MAAPPPPPRKDNSPLFANAPPQFLAFAWHESITSAEIIAFLINWIRCHGITFRLASNGVSNQTIETMVNYFRAPSAKGQVGKNAICKMVQKAMRDTGLYTFPGTKKWTISLHQTNNTKNFYGPWNAANLELTGVSHILGTNTLVNDVRFDSLAIGVQRFPSRTRGDGLNLTTCVRYALTHPQENLMFPRDFTALVNRLGRRSPLNIHEDEQVFARWVNGVIPAPAAPLIQAQVQVPPANIAPVQPVGQSTVQPAAIAPILQPVAVVNNPQPAGQPAAVAPSAQTAGNVPVLQGTGIPQPQLVAGFTHSQLQPAVFAPSRPTAPAPHNSADQSAIDESIAQRSAVFHHFQPAAFVNQHGISARHPAVFAHQPAAYGTAPPPSVALPGPDPSNIAPVLRSAARNNVLRAAATRQSTRSTALKPSSSGIRKSSSMAQAKKSHTDKARAERFERLQGTFERNVVSAPEQVDFERTEPTLQDYRPPANQDHLHMNGMGFDPVYGQVEHMGLDPIYGQVEHMGLDPVYGQIRDGFRTPSLESTSEYIDRVHHGAGNGYQFSQPHMNDGRDSDEYLYRPAASPVAADQYHGDQTRLEEVVGYIPPQFSPYPELNDNGELQLNEYGPYYPHPIHELKPWY